MQDGESARDALQRMDDVLDPDDRRPLRMDGGEDGDQVVTFGVGEAAGDLVEQQELGLGGDRLGELETLEVKQRQRPGGLGGERGETGPRQRLVRLATNTLICAKGLGT
jgi:hypothetical protein